MPNKTKCSDSRKRDYTAYKAQDKAELNKLIKLEKHMKTHPNDKQSQERYPADYKVKKGSGTKQK